MARHPETHTTHGAWRSMTEFFEPGKPTSPIFLRNKPICDYSEDRLIALTEAIGVIYEPMAKETHSKAPERPRTGRDDRRNEALLLGSEDAQHTPKDVRPAAGADSGAERPTDQERG